MGEGGGCFFHFKQDGVYEVHTMFLPESRGKYVLEFCRAAGDWMFKNTEASEIWTQCPVCNLAATALTRAVGGKPDRREKDAFNHHGKLYDIVWYKMTFAEWQSIRG